MLPAGPGAERQNQAFAWTPGGRRPRPGSSRASDGHELPTAPSPTGSWPGAPGSAVQPRPRGHVPPTGHGQGAWSDGQARVREGPQRSEGRGRQLPGGGCGRLGTRGAAEPGSPSQEPCVWKRFKNRSVKQRDPPKRPREGKTAPSLEGGYPPAGKPGWGPRREQAGQDPSPSAVRRAGEGGRCAALRGRSPAATAASSATFTEKVNSGVLQLAPKSDSDLPPGEGKARSCLGAGPGSARRPRSCRWPGVSWPAGLHRGPTGRRTRLPSTPRLTEGQRARRQTQVPLGQG